MARDQRRFIDENSFTNIEFQSFSSMTKQQILELFDYYYYYETVDPWTIRLLLLLERLFETITDNKSF